MCYIELIKRIVPFFLTFVIGLILTSFVFSMFTFVSPANTEVKESQLNNQQVEVQEVEVERYSYDYRRNSCWKMKQQKRKKRHERRNSR